MTPCDKLTVANITWWAVKGRRWYASISGKLPTALTCGILVVYISIYGVDELSLITSVGGMYYVSA